MMQASLFCAVVTSLLLPAAGLRLSQKDDEGYVDKASGIASTTRAPTSIASGALCGAVNYGLVDSEPQTPSCLEKKDARFAVVLYGHVAMRKGKVEIYPHSQVPSEIHYGNVAKVSRNLFANLVEPSRVGNNTVDFFVHSYTQSTAIRDRLKQMYKPKAMLWEGERYNLKDFEGFLSPAKEVSRYTGIAKALTLVRDAEKKQGWRYDKVYVGRPDVYLTAKIDLRRHCDDRAYINHCPGCEPDFHFIVTSEQAEKMSNIADHWDYKFGTGHPRACNGEILRRYFSEQLNTTLVYDDVSAGVGEEACHKSRACYVA